MSKDKVDNSEKVPASQDIDKIKSIIEALLFASYDPLSAQKIKTIIQNDFELTTTDIKKTIYKIKEEFEAEGRGFEIVEIAGGYHIRTKKEFSKWLEILLNKRKKETLSQAALETLSIIAYRQPVTKADIEDIRGVNADGVVHKLLEKGFITIFKKKDAPSFPYYYVTSAKFLEHFGLRSLSDLPKLDHRLTLS
ncbi:MAG: SMC-Scp complex subunit ScpB [Candidatus Aureabacteria bacterium]|nr:SMC-Scp complex subunit ScpB [Candidatus Auribacterota bacterium]